MPGVLNGPRLAAAVFVSFGDLAFLDLLAGSGIMRPERDPGRGGALIPISAGIVGAEPRYRWRRTLLPATPIRQVVLAHIDRRRLPHLVGPDVGLPEHAGAAAGISGAPMIGIEVAYNRCLAPRFTLAHHYVGAVWPFVRRRLAQCHSGLGGRLARAAAQRQSSRTRWPLAPVVSLSRQRSCRLVR